MQCHMRNRMAHLCLLCRMQTMFRWLTLSILTTCQLACCHRRISNRSSSSTRPVIQLLCQFKIRMAVFTFATLTILVSAQRMNIDAHLIAHTTMQSCSFRCRFWCLCLRFADANGLFYYLGTNGKRTPWQNAADMGLVRCSSTQLAFSPPSESLSYLVGRDTVRLCTVPKPDMWMCVDLKDKYFAPTHYTLRHYISWDTEALRNWRFEGSVDGNVWETLKVHVDDKSLNKKGATHTWTIQQPPTRFYREFRIFQFGVNSNGNHYLCCSGMELYGILQAPGYRPQLAAAQGSIMNPAFQPPSHAPLQAPPSQALVRPGSSPLPPPPALGVGGQPSYRDFQDGMEFHHTADFDENGILYFIGTQQYTQRWVNPGEAGYVRVTSVPLAIEPRSEPASAIVGRSCVRCVTLPNRESWFCIDLLKWWVRPTAYTLRHYDSWDTEALRDWKLQASNDGKKWTKLMSHKKDCSLNCKGATKTWFLPKSKKSYRMFRILQTVSNVLTALNHVRSLLTGCRHESVC